MVSNLRRSALAALVAAAMAMVGAGCARPAASPPMGPAVGLTLGATGLAAWLESVPPSQRLEWRDLEAGCGDQRDCRRELDRFAQELRARCPEATGCADPVAAMLYVERTAAQRSSGLYPDALPRAGDILTAWQAVMPTPTPREPAP